MYTLCGGKLQKALGKRKSKVFIRHWGAIEVFGIEVFRRSVVRKQVFRKTDPVTLDRGAVGMEEESENPELATQVMGH